jgi:hypothetical protein
VFVVVVLGIVAVLVAVALVVVVPILERQVVISVAASLVNFAVVSITSLTGVQIGHSSGVQFPPNPTGLGLCCCCWSPGGFILFRCIHIMLGSDDCC